MMLNRNVSLAIATSLGLAACGHYKEEARPSAKKDKINALARESFDGATEDAGETGDGENGAALVAAQGKGANGETRDCKADGARSVTVTRRWVAPTDAPWLAAAGDDQASVKTETFTAGPRFGTSPAGLPNVGYTSPNRSVRNGAPVTPQPTSLACSAAAWAAVGWQFSHNVAGLASASDLRLTTNKWDRATGETVRTTVVGRRNAVYADPRDVAPYRATPSAPYFDEAAQQSVVTRQVTYGTAGQPNHVTVVRGKDGSVTSQASYTLRTSPEAPLVETVVRDLTPGWPLRERHLASGTFEAAYADGAVVKTSLAQVVLRRDAEGRTSCRPVSGTITSVYVSPKAGAPVVTVTNVFGADAGGIAGQRTDVACSSGNANQCLAAAQKALESYRIPHCLY